MTEQKRLTRALEALCAWYRAGHRDLPWRRTPEPYPVWVSEIMLQQTRVQAVIPYYERFLRALPTVQALAEAPEEQLLKLWEGLGYYSRARNLQRAARVICTQYGGEVPTSREQLLALPGIGPYTAGAVASIAGGERCPAVDGNVLRVLSRLFARTWYIRAQRTKRQAEEELTAAMSEQSPGDCNQALMELGAVVCLPNGEPLCGSCPIAPLCRAHADGAEQQYPVRAPKKQRPVERRAVFLLWNNGRLALRKRPETGLLAGLWEFPNCPEGGDPAEQLGVPLRNMRQTGRAKHIFTHLEWHMTGWTAQTEETGYFTWVTPQQLERDIALPSAFRAFRRMALTTED